MLTTAPKGTRDVLPGQSYLWHAIEDTIRGVCRAYGYREIRVPTFEHTELFQRGMGDTTDAVQKEMYTFEDRGGRSISLKPEGTAGVARAFVEHSLYNEPQPVKLYYLTSPVFRYERPQAGRLREHHQFGIEAFGAPGADMDAEVILLALQVIHACGLTDLRAQINTIGCPVCRPPYHALLVEYLGRHLDRLCPACKERYARNPLRALDCKEPSCQALTAGAPAMLDHVCDACRAHFDALQRYLTDMDVPYDLNRRIVRGFDYYTRTVFEIIAPRLGAQNAVCGGGRYDGLIETVGGPPTCGVGFGMGMERLLLAMQSVDALPAEPPLYDVFIAAMGDAPRRAAFALAQRLRAAGIAAGTDNLSRSFKAQFKYADKTGARWCVVIGEDELAAGEYQLKDMRGGAQQALPAGAIERHLIQALQSAKE